MRSTQVTETFLDFYRSHRHRFLTGTSLIPTPGDPVLYTTSGMHPLTPYFDGGCPHPDGRRLMNVQRCLRTTDIEEVGDRTHLTVFQMLGTWSLGDYDGNQSIRWGLEVLRDGFGFPDSHLHVTVFGGGDGVEPDTDSLNTWQDLGIPVELTSGTENWWSNGPTGPCGPDTEVFFWTGQGDPTGTPTTDERWVEIWNHVLMHYRRLDDGGLVPLPQRNVDTGMGLERLVMVLQQKTSVFETDLFDHWRTVVQGLWQPQERDLRLLCDHLRSTVVVTGDGVSPSNLHRGYVLRRLIRRTLTTLWRHDPDNSLTDLPLEPVSSTLDQFGLDLDPQKWGDMIDQEENRFRRLLTRGRPLVEKHLRHGPLTGDTLRRLHDTHGLPPELVTGYLTDLIVGGRPHPPESPRRVARRRDQPRRDSAGPTRRSGATYLGSVARPAVSQPPRGRLSGAPAG
jgi:alanyl-tRNA synthetase